MRKDIKKSSYYVWFLGAQEAKGLRGAEFITPVVRSLVERERDVEPFKVTLQISHKGLKIVQNVPSTSATPKTTAGKKGELVKHFIPQHAVTCVLQDEDIVACILLLYNPVTKCPAHVHAYRCDSVETATLLSSQLRTLTDTPDRKLAELEAKLHLPAAAAESHSRPAPGQASLYDSLAAELRDKLGSTSSSPILLPPRDYDTVHRQKGNLSDIDKRRCLNFNIVGMSAKSPPPPPLTTRPQSKASGSRGSSGIGSDLDPPSPNHSTSDEEWNCDAAKNQCVMVTELSLPRLSSRADVVQPPRSHQQAEASRSSQLLQRRKNAEERQRSATPPDTPRERFNDAKEKFLQLERERLEQQERRRQSVEPPISPYQRSKPSASWAPNRDSEEDQARLAKDRYYDDDDDDYDKNRKYLEERDRPPVIRRESMYRKVRSRDSIDSEEYNSSRHRSIYPVDSRRSTCVSPTQRSDMHGSYSPPAPLEAGAARIPLERYRSPKTPEKKKPVYELMEEERRRSSNELAKEFKRRSYHELDDHERYPGLDRETAASASASASASDENSPRYRHSYAEYHGIKHQLLHRTNSSVSSGRVGIAAIHPY